MQRKPRQICKRPRNISRTIMVEEPQVESHAPQSQARPSQTGLMSVWRSPAWIAAIAGLVSVVFTIPQIAVSYFQTNAEVERQRIVTRGSFIDKALSTDTIEDRLVVLRWLKLSGLETDDRVWAQSEIEKIDDVLRKEAEVEDLKLKLSSLAEEAGKDNEQYRQISAELASKDKELSNAQSQVGSLSNELKALKDEIEILKFKESQLQRYRTKLLDACGEFGPAPRLQISDPNDPRIIEQRRHDATYKHFCSLNF